MILIGHGADKGLTGRTVAPVLMLSAVVRNRGVLFTVVSVVVGSFTTGSTGSGSFVSGRVVILPGTVGFAFQLIQELSGFLVGAAHGSSF